MLFKKYESGRVLGPKSNKKGLWLARAVTQRAALIYSMSVAQGVCTVCAVPPLAAASLVAQHKCPPLRPCCSSCVADQCSWSLSLQSVCCRSWGTGQNCFLASLPALLWPQQAVKAGRWALEYLKPWHLWALIVFFSQQVFNPNLSFNEWNLTEMEASLSPVSNVCFWDSNNNNDDDDARLVHNWRMLRYFTDRGESVKAQQIHICCG